MSDLVLDPKTFQYKESTAEGSTGALDNATEWMQEGVDAHPLMLYERKKEGSPGEREYVVVNGHQRTLLARRLLSEGHKPIYAPAVVIDGETQPTVGGVRRGRVSKATVKSMGALLNIMENTGTALDAALVLRSANPEMLEHLGGVKQTSAMYRQGRALSELDDATFKYYTDHYYDAPLEADRVPPNFASLVSQSVMDGSLPPERVAEIHMRTMRELVAKRREIRSVDYAQKFVVDAANSLSISGGTSTGEAGGRGAQGSFFENTELQNLRPVKTRIATVAESMAKAAGGKLESSARAAELLEGLEGWKTNEESARAAGKGLKGTAQLVDYAMTFYPPTALRLQGLVEAVSRDELTVDQAAAEWLGASGKAEPGTVRFHDQDGSILEFMTKDPEVQRSEWAKSRAQYDPDLTNATLDELFNEVNNLTTHTLRFKGSEVKRGLDILDRVGERRKKAEGYGGDFSYEPTVKAAPRPLMDYQTKVVNRIDAAIREAEELRAQAEGDGRTAAETEARRKVSELQTQKAEVLKSVQADLRLNVEQNIVRLKKGISDLEKDLRGLGVTERERARSKVAGARESIAKADRGLQETRDKAIAAAEAGVSSAEAAVSSAEAENLAAKELGFESDAEVKSAQKALEDAKQALSNVEEKISKEIQRKQGELRKEIERRRPNFVNEVMGSEEYETKVADAVGDTVDENRRSATGRDLFDMLDEAEASGQYSSASLGVIRDRVLARSDALQADMERRMQDVGASEAARAGRVRMSAAERSAQNESSSGRRARARQMQSRGDFEGLQRQVTDLALHGNNASAPDVRYIMGMFTDQGRGVVQVNVLNGIRDFRMGTVDADLRGDAARAASALARGLESKYMDSRSPGIESLEAAFGENWGQVLKMAKGQKAFSVWWRGYQAGADQGRRGRKLSERISQMGLGWNIYYAFSFLALTPAIIFPALGAIGLGMATVNRLRAQYGRSADYLRRYVDRGDSGPAEAPVHEPSLRQMLDAFRRASMRAPLLRQAGQEDEELLEGGSAPQSSPSGAEYGGIAF